MKIHIYISLFLLPFLSTAQPKINIQPLFGNQPLQLETKWYSLHDTDSIAIDVLKFYISAIELLQDDKPIWIEKNSFHLVDASQTATLLIPLSVPEKIIYNAIKLNVGIDSLTNSAGAKGGDLDPTTGMYWTWQTGYINFKLEGRSTECDSRKNEFQFHIGGYAAPNNSLQTIRLPFSSVQNTITIDLRKMLFALNLKSNNHIMSPGEPAIKVAQLIPQVVNSVKP